jgi:hypothetical protein
MDVSSLGKSYSIVSFFFLLDYTHGRGSRDWMVANLVLETTATAGRKKGGGKIIGN